MWRSAVLTEIPSVRAICLVCRPRASRPTHLGLALGQPGGPLDPRRRAGRPPRCTAADHVGVEPPGAGLLAEGLRRPLRRQRARGAAAARSSRGRRRRRRAAGPAAAARRRPTRGGSRSRRGARGGRAATGASVGEERRTGEDPLGVIRVQPHLLPLVGASAARASARCGRGDRDPPEVVDERGAPDATALAGSSRAAARPPPRALPRRPSGREVRARSVGEARPSPRAPGRSPRPSSVSHGLRLQASASSQPSLRIERRESRRHRRRGTRRPRGRTPGRHARRRGAPRCSAPPSSRWKAASSRTCTIRIASGISSPRARPQRTLAVPALGQVGERPRHRVG